VIGVLPSVDIYSEMQWDTNNAIADELANAAAVIKADPRKHIDNLKYIFNNKIAGKKSFLLMQAFKRNVETAEVRVEFVVKRI